jgi:hypothetical protein
LVLDLLSFALTHYNPPVAVHFRRISTTTTTTPTNETSAAVDASDSASPVAVYVENTCVAYPANVARDGSWTTAYGLQIASWALSGLAWIGLLWLLLFRPRQQPPQRLGGILAVCGFGVVLGGVALQGLVFLFFQSDLCTDSPLPGIQQLQQMGVMQAECQLGSAAILLIAAMALYFVAGIAACAASRTFAPTRQPPRVAYPRRDRDDSGDEDGDNNNNANGMDNDEKA